MSDLQFKSPEELQSELGRRVQQLRLSRNLDQRAVADKAGITRAALQNLEAGRGSSVKTLVRTLKALNYLEGIEILAPEPMRRIEMIELGVDLNAAFLAFDRGFSAGSRQQYGPLKINFRETTSVWVVNGR